MQITLTRKELTSAFPWVYKGLPKYPAVPVLAGTLLSVSGQRLTLAVFDYQQSRRVTVPGKDGAARPGEILVDGRVLKKLLGTLPAADVELAADDAALTVTAGESTWRLPALPRSEYPALPDLPPEAGVLGGPSFARSVTRVAAAASKDGTLPALTGINFTTRPGYLGLAATDRYRIAVDRPSWTAAGPDAKPREALLPAAALTEFAQTAGKADKVTVGLSGELAGFSDGVHELAVHSISTDHGSKGAHARYLKYLRGTSPIVLTADARDLAEAVRAVGKMAERNVPVVLRYEDGQVTAQVSQDGEVVMTQAFRAALKGASGLRVGFNPVFLSSLLDGFTGQVRTGFTNSDGASLQAVTLRQRGDTFTPVLMTQKLP